ncbi:MAG: hypothetical protein A2845_02940 [Candidatus Lloydbacteria bacterium RIFCSPHIGHO2_01_FULL_49_22]|uniref:DUF5671 domain-containing protein n=1 Tax=Candidatus Lloydbacteria bacterium RIFCSPHIGHO2_01_FULL_49_22 TaxID=1798658 RepID=A0A1G2CV50_9BACT|nr:MAG: hypothetical protein A2845_02940 [Candidatus Lloydbacteria bacterium RIFCSPHIGHO2_01_FULL_49_22]OGZ10397.1 MAG: hypothetical protein A3C14_02640 [Candidatus Lloydbacteria bacterium RIFCSPHIGHO2_02_FULL_50_18]
MRTINKQFGIATLLGTPSLVFAQVTDVFDLEVLVYNILVKAGQFFWIAAIMFFFWGVVKFIGNANDPVEREKGKQFIIWGIIAFVVLFSVWGIVRILLVDTFGIMPGGAPDYVDSTGGIH